MSLTDDASTTQTDSLAKRNLFSLLFSQPKIQQNQSPRDAHRAHTPSAMMVGWNASFRPLLCLAGNIGQPSYSAI